MCGRSNDSGQATATAAADEDEDEDEDDEQRAGDTARQAPRKGHAEGRLLRPTEAAQRRAPAEPFNRRADTGGVAQEERRYRERGVDTDSVRAEDVGQGLGGLTATTAIFVVSRPRRPRCGGSGVGAGWPGRGMDMDPGRVHEHRWQCAERSAVTRQAHRARRQHVPRVQVPRGVGEGPPRRPRARGPRPGAASASWHPGCVQFLVRDERPARARRRVRTMNRHRRPPRRTPWIAGGALILALGGVGVWALVTQDGDTPRPKPSSSTDVSLPTLNPVPTWTPKPQAPSTPPPTASEPRSTGSASAGSRSPAPTGSDRTRPAGPSEERSAPADGTGQPQPSGHRPTAHRTTARATATADASAGRTREATPTHTRTAAPRPLDRPPRPVTTPAPVRPPRPSTPAPSPSATTAPPEPVTPAPTHGGFEPATTTWYTSATAVGAARRMAVAGVVGDPACSMAAAGRPDPSLVPQGGRIDIGRYGRYWCLIW